MTDNSQQTPLIAIVDDDRSMRMLLNMAMEDTGYRVAEASNGEQFLAEYENLQPDLILLDAMMPGMDGFTCCQKIRSLPRSDRVAIMMITALDDLESIQQALDVGANDYITKPIEWRVLSDKVERLLATSNL